MCWMFCQLYLLLFLLPQPQHALCSARCRNMGSKARWAIPKNSPMSAICQGFPSCPLTHCKATSSKAAHLSSLRHCTQFTKRALTWRKASIYLIVKRWKKKEYWERLKRTKFPKSLVSNIIQNISSMPQKHKSDIQMHSLHRNAELPFAVHNGRTCCFNILLCQSQCKALPHCCR